MRNFTDAVNNLLETNCRPGSPVGAAPHFGRAVHAQAYAFGGGRSANRSASKK